MGLAARTEAADLRGRAHRPWGTPGPRGPPGAARTYLQLLQLLLGERCLPLGRARVFGRRRVQGRQRQRLPGPRLLLAPGQARRLVPLRGLWREWRLELRGPACRVLSGLGPPVPRRELPRLGMRGPVRGARAGRRVGGERRRMSRLFVLSPPRAPQTSHYETEHAR